MAYTLNTSHALYGNLIELIGVQSGALVSHKTARTFTKNAAASYGSGTYGEHLQTGNGGYSAQGASFSPAIAFDTYLTTNYTILIVGNSFGGSTGTTGIVTNPTGSYGLLSPSFGNAGGTITGDEQYNQKLTSATAVGTTAHSIAVTRTGETASELFKDGVSIGTGGMGHYNNASTAIDYMGGFDGQGSQQLAIVWIAVFDKVLTAAELLSLHNSLGANNTFSLVVAGGTNASAGGGTGTSTGSGTGGAATGGAGGSASASGGTGTSTGSGAGGAASVGASGTFTTVAMENNTGAGLLASTAVSWTWYQGAIGAAPTATVSGTGTTNAGGILTVNGLPSGAGFLLVRTADSSGVYYQAGTV